jgi:hypothetical protein
MNGESDTAPIHQGSRVLLFPRSARADCADAAIEGRTATVEALLRDITGRSYVAVLVEDAQARSDVLANLLLLRADEVRPVSEVGSRLSPTRASGT